MFFADMIKIMRYKAGAGNTIIFVFSHPHTGKITFNTTLVVQHLGIDQRPHGFGHIIGGNPVQRRLGIRPLEHELAQGCLIKQHRGLARSTVLTAYCGMPVGAFKRIDITLLLGRIRVRIQIGPFPAKFFAKNRAIHF